MALLQISEPGQAPDPHQRRHVVGIDLGTTHSLVAALRHGVAECLPDAQGRTLLPSVVRYLPHGGRQMGWDALAAQTQDPENTIASFKRFMGRSLTDIQAHAAMPYRFLDQPGMVTLSTCAGNKTPVELSAEVLATLRQRAEDTLDDELWGAVITVPAYFDDAQRQATKDAAKLAGIEVLRLLNEPTAAAIAYGLENASEGIYAVYDLGGGTFDISILRLTQGVFEVIATGGDSALGGDDYDRLLVNWLLQQADLRVDTAGDKTALLFAARQCKENLSTQASVEFTVELSTGRLSRTISQAQFHELSAALTQRTLQAVKRALRDAQLEPAAVKGVVMVGGSTRMPQVQAAVAQLFGQPHQLAGRQSAGDLLLLDVIPLSLGIETMGGLVERIVPRNQTIPTAMAQDFTTYKDGQTALALHVVQGERDLVADCRSLARFELRGIPPMAAGAAHIRVSFTVDADGLLTVTAKEQSSGVQAQIDVKPSYGLSDEQIARMLQDSFATAQQDIQARALAEARLEADRMLLAVQSALSDDGDLLTPQELKDVQAQMHQLAQIKTSDQAQRIEAATAELAAQTETLAARRMNRGIQQALTGRNIHAI
jgi:molecular chaperone HscA